MKKCIFCSSVIANPEALIITMNEQVVVFLDKFPRTRGHLLVAPAQHFQDFYSIPPETRTAVFDHVGRFCDVLKAYGAKGINIGSNIGEVAGQQVPHFHIHVIPRYEKDDAVEIEPAFVNTPWRQKSLSLPDEEMRQVCNEISRLHREL
jgi:histidine triad (HIT) family protein